MTMEMKEQEEIFRGLYYWKMEKHLKEYLPRKYKELKEAGILDSHLLELQDKVIDILQDQYEAGLGYSEAMEFVRDILYPTPEADLEEQ